MTEPDQGWLRRFVGGGRRRDDEIAPVETDAKPLPPAEADLEANLQLLFEQNTQLAEDNQVQQQRILELEATAQRAAAFYEAQNVDALKSKLRKQDRDLRIAREAADAAVKRLPELREEAKELERKCHRERERAASLEAANHNLTTQAGPLREGMRRTQKQLHFLQTQLDKERATRGAAEAKLTGSAARTAELEEQLLASRQRASERSSRLDACKQELAALQEQAEQAEVRNRALRQRHRAALHHLFGDEGPMLVQQLLGDANAIPNLQETAHDQDVVDAKDFTQAHLENDHGKRSSDPSKTPS